MIKIFYDNKCVICNGFVRMLLKHLTPGAQIKFAPQNNSHFKQLQEEFKDLEFPDSLTIYDKASHQVYFKSHGIKKLQPLVKFPLNFLIMLFRLIPTCIADWLYDLVARNRYRFKSTTCSVMPPEWKSYFED